MRSLILYFSIIGVHSFGIIIFLAWYLHDGYLGFGYGDLYYVAMIAAALVIIILLLAFPPKDHQMRWVVMFGLLLFDIWFIGLLARTIW